MMCEPEYLLSTVCTSPVPVEPDIGLQREWNSFIGLDD